MTTSPDPAGGLQGILDDIRACRACLGQLPHTPRPVVHVFPETRLLICGQAPGRRVHESGLPFTDPSGDRLRDWMGVDYETFYADRRIGVGPEVEGPDDLIEGAVQVVGLPAGELALCDRDFLDHGRPRRLRRGRYFSRAPSF